VGAAVAAFFVIGASAALANGDHDISWSGHGTGNSTIQWNSTKGFYHSTNVHSQGEQLYAGAYPTRNIYPDPGNVYHLTGDTTFDAHGSGNVSGRTGELAWDAVLLAIYENVSFSPDPHGPQKTDSR
jgi:hypothetical protein